MVANGTPSELKAKAEAAGSVTLRVFGTAAETVKSRLGSLMVAGRVSVSTASNAVTARIFPRDRNVNGELARAVAELGTKEGWKFDELHTEEGRLDDVFRAITLPDTIKAKE